MQQVSSSGFGGTRIDGGSARVSEAVARVMQARRGETQAEVRPKRKDPAPTRAAYRLHRLWLTPSFRFFLRRVAPALVVVAGIGVWLADAEHREILVEGYTTIKYEFQNRPEFMVKLMAVDGASEELSNDIREIIAVDFPVSSFDLDLKGMLAQVESLDAVASAGLRVRAGGILQLDVKERVPAVVWRGPHGLELLDVAGHRVGAVGKRIDRNDLPLVAGLGAERHVAEAMSILRAAQPLRSRVRGLVRVGERRWDIVLDRDQRIMLPELDPLGAIAQVVALDKARDMMARDLTIVDMRNAARPTVRLVPEAEEPAEIRVKETGEASR